MIMYKGINWLRTMTVSDESGAAVDLTGKDIQLEVRRYSSEAVLLSASVGAGITLQNQTTTPGKADIAIDGDLITPLETASHVLRILIDGQVRYPPTHVIVRD